LLPRDPEVAEAIAVRLRLSNKARKRLACVAADGLEPSPRALAYRVGNECAVDRLLLAGRARDAAEIAAWKAPRLPIGGGALIQRGLTEGPIVARTLKRIEDRWIEAGFPGGEEFQRIVSNALDEAR
jgi:poly(A) polymerase